MNDPKDVINKMIGGKKTDRRITSLDKCDLENATELI